MNDTGGSLSLFPLLTVVRSLSAVGTAVLGGKQTKKQAAQRNLALQLVAAQQGPKKKDKTKNKKKKANVKPPLSPFATHSAMDIKRYDSRSPTNFQ